MSEILKETAKKVCDQYGQGDELKSALLNWISRVQTGAASAEDQREGIALAEQLIEKVKVL